MGRVVPIKLLRAHEEFPYVRDITLALRLWMGKHSAPRPFRCRTRRDPAVVTSAGFATRKQPSIGAPSP